MTNHYLSYEKLQVKTYSGYYLSIKKILFTDYYTITVQEISGMAYIPLIEWLKLLLWITLETIWKQRHQRVSHFWTTPHPCYSLSLIFLDLCLPSPLPLTKNWKNNPDNPSMYSWFNIMCICYTISNHNDFCFKRFKESFGPETCNVLAELL